MKIMRHVGFMIVLSGIVQSAFGDLPRRPMPGATTAPAAAASAPAAPTRPAPPARMKPPYKPLELSNPSAGLQQSVVRWKIPDQSDGRLIEQWLVRACPQVDGTPYAACQQVQQLNGPDGQMNGTYVQAQIPAHVTYMGMNTPVNGAEICSVNSAGTSCADRIAVRFVNPGIAPAPARIHGAAPSGTPLGATGIGVAPQGGQGSAGAAHPGTTRGIVVAKQPTAQQTPEHVMSAGTGGGSAPGSLVRKPAIATAMPGQAQTVHAAQITADGTGAALSVSVIPGLVHTSPIAADGTGTLINPVLKPSLRLKKGS